MLKHIHVHTHDINKITVVPPNRAAFQFVLYCCGGYIHHKKIYMVPMDRARQPVINNNIAWGIKEQIDRMHPHTWRHLFIDVEKQRQSL